MKIKIKRVVTEKVEEEPCWGDGNNLYFILGGVYRCIYFHNSSNLLNKLNYKLCLNEKEIKQITLFRGCSGDQVSKVPVCVDLML